MQTSIYKSHNTQISDVYLLNENWIDSIALSELVVEGPVLILRITKNSCQECAMMELNHLENFIKNNRNKACLIYSSQTSRDLKALTLLHSFSFLKLGSFKLDILKIPEEIYNSPYYFILDANLTGRMFFFPDKSNAELTQKYFQEVCDFFSNNKY